MTSGVVKVSYPTLQDLYFRTRNLKLEHETYRVSFLTWVKGGIAFNVRGAEVSTRKISYFGDLYRKLREVEDYSTIADELGLAITRYYEDFFLLYQDHLTAVLNTDGRKGKAVKSLYANLVYLPSFEDVPKMATVFPTKQIVLDEYVPANPESLHRDMVMMYVEDSWHLYKCMAMYYDHSLKSDGNVVLLEVK